MDWGEGKSLPVQASLSAQEKRPLSPFLCTYMERQDTGRGQQLPMFI
jgi:hypothetical protein